jgi:glutamyl-tRNA synthetase
MLRFFGHFFVKSEAKLDVLRRFKFSAVAMGVRTRFAPSPTGDLHIGGARTALFAWLFARRHQGVFILRIEDTDRERSTAESAEVIIEAMRWLNLDYDEGPYYQSQRFDRYAQVLQQLLDAGKAYRCYCSKERLETLREQQTATGQKPRYDGHCRELTDRRSGPCVIRFRNPQTGVVTFNDMVRGPISISNTELDDLILARSDGTPTYNFVVVVDDWDMRMTHVIRGDDHINNTPRQINILQALGAAIPEYGHVPTILGSDGKRLSKRHGAAGVLEYREAGFLPEALLNYLVRLGWSYQDQEIFSRDEMIQYFDVHHLQRAPAAFNAEKLAWLNQHYLKTVDKSITARALGHLLTKKGVDYEQGPSLPDVVGMFAERAKTLGEMADNCRYFFTEVSGDPAVLEKHLSADSMPMLQLARDRLQALAEWSPAVIHQTLKDLAEEQSVNLGKIAQPLRVAVTGGTVSPPIDVTLYHLGRDRVVSRISRVLSGF